MPRYSTYPTLFDECRIISISDLRKWKYLELNTIKSVTITWRNEYDEVTSRLPIQIIMNENKTVVILNYKCNDNSYNYEIQLTSIPSNLGKGVVWFFICPFTRKRCRKLHLLDERFIHRSAFPSGMYECQTKSKKWRGWDKVYGSYYETDRLYEQLYSKHFKKFYAGKPTKKYLRIMKQIKRAERLTSYDLKQLF